MRQGLRRLRLAYRLGVSARDLVVEKKEIPTDAIGRVRSLSLVRFVGCGESGHPKVSRLPLPVNAFLHIIPTSLSLHPPPPTIASEKIGSWEEEGGAFATRRKLSSCSDGGV